VELSALTKKSPHDALNQFKLKFINSVLKKCNQVLGKKNKPFEDFSEFDTEVLPSNSDVNMMLSQYIEAIRRFRHKMPEDDEDSDFGDDYDEDEAGE
jgi:hypothetical protein